MAAASVAFVLKGYPRLSETFIAQEIRSLERLGLDIRIYSMRRPTDGKRHPVHDEISAPVVYLPEYLYQEPGRVFRGWRKARRLAGYAKARRVWRRDLARDLTPNRIRRFGQACVLAAELPPEIGRIHAHFLHTPASVARYAALMRGLPWSVSAHAKDIWTTPDREIAEKLADAEWAVTCTRAGQARLAGLAARPQAVALAYHGLDLARFPAPAAARPPRDGAEAAAPAIVLSVGRAVPKKGFGLLLTALARLPKALAWRFEHVGGGPGLPQLKAEAARLGIAERVTWHGGQAQAAVLEAYRRADLFALASRIADDGDRDGLPNVLMEAQSQALACVATDVSAIPELIANGETGLLVPPEDAAALAAALERLIREPALRARLGGAGQAKIRASFDHARTVGDLARRFGLA
ncbi:MAG TPA: glycosyltransferase family 4 protein [Alphaproteobacteria bacterium]|jgi:glycosyltransferase involved in cell wall biosynthesis